jgi:hypothetical protein
MVIAPAPGDGKIQFVAPGTLEGPAIILHRTLEHIERMGGGNGLVLMGKGHPALLDTNERAQIENEAVRST